MIKMNIKIKYTHPAFNEKIKVGQVYECNIKNNKEVEIIHNKCVILSKDLNFVKTFFSPTSGLKWSDILSTKPENQENIKIKKTK